MNLILNWIQIKIVYDLENNGWRRNTQPLNLIEEDLEYPYLFIPNKFNQTAKVAAVTPGKNFKCWYSNWW
jgi:hypothetical protein